MSGADVARRFTVAVAGASGYAGGELLRLLAGHPLFEVCTVTGHSSAGRRLVEVQPHLLALKDLVLRATTPDVLDGHDIVFFALPHGASGELAASLRDVRLQVDCGADHRLEDAGDWQAFYGDGFCEPWVYGVPELPVAARPRLSREGAAAAGSLVGVLKQREFLRAATRVAAPGCNASTVALSLAPGIAAGLIEPADIVSVLAVGPSGAGKTAKTSLLASEIMGSASAYAVGGSHRHIPEILQALRRAAVTTGVPDMPDTTGKLGAPGAAEPFSISFTPALVPMSRGILATSTARVRPGVTASQLREAWLHAYADEPFVHVLPEGAYPRTADTLGANTCQMGLTLDLAAGRVVVVAALDNLVKGTAGAAIQSANIALGLTETLGLTQNGVAP